MELKVGDRVIYSNYGTYSGKVVKIHTTDDGYRFLELDCPQPEGYPQEDCFRLVTPLDELL